MASSFFLYGQFEEVLVYLNSIRSFFSNDDIFNYNYAQAKAATGYFKEAEELLRDINPRNDEVMGLKVQSVDEILRGNPLDYRQGVQPWLGQLHDSGLITTPAAQLQEIDFGSILFGSKDIQIDR